MIKKKVIEQPELNFWEKIYIPEVTRGIWDSSKHFFKNLTLHTLHLIGLFKKVAASVTISYPEIQWLYPKRLRTLF